MSEPPLEQRFAVLCEIVRAQHFAWREAVAQLCPDVDPGAVVERMWELVGADTARSYARRIDRSRPLAEQAARSIAWSSQCMGETAAVEPGSGDEAFVRHTDCPWQRWHQKLGLEAEDRAGCDRWFGATLEKLGEALGADLRFATLEALPEGGSCCLRRLWVEG